MSSNAAKLFAEDPVRNPTPISPPRQTLSTDNLAIARALLRYWGEDDPEIIRDWLAGLADPERLEQMREMAVQVGVARYEPIPEPVTEPEIDPRPKAVCACCTRWTPDTINPPGGRGRCLIDAPASRKPGSCWPWIKCSDEVDVYCDRFSKLGSLA